MATVFTVGLSVAFFFWADTIYNIWTTDSKTLALCNSITPLMVYGIASSIVGAQP